MTDDRMIKWFDYSHLPHEQCRAVAQQFSNLARYIVFEIDQGPERTVALRKLLEAKDAAVRATIHKGG